MADQDPSPPAEESTDFSETIMSSNSSYGDLKNKESKLDEALMDVAHETYISVADKTQKDPLAPQRFTCESDKKKMQIVEEMPLPKSEKEAISSSNSSYHDSIFPPNKKLKPDNDVLHALNAESPAICSSGVFSMQDLQAKPFKCLNWLRALPAGCRFRPTDCEISRYFLKKKALGEPMKTRYVPEECSPRRIFSQHPCDWLDDPEEKHFYFYCRKLDNQVTTPNLWTHNGEETDVVDDNGAIVGIKRRFTLSEQEEESNDIFLSDEEEYPRYIWFIDEIKLPLTVAKTDWRFCHVFREKVPESEEEEEEEEEKTVLLNCFVKLASSLKLILFICL